MTGFMEPTAADKAAGVTASFGTTTNIMNGGYECGKGSETDKSRNRISYYTAFLDHFDLDKEDEASMGCKSQSKFPAGGYGDAKAYFAKDNSQKGCKIVPWMTGHSIYARDDYKRCVCEMHGRGEADCKTVPSEDKKEDKKDEKKEDKKEEQKKIVVEDSDLKAEFDAIRKKQHYSDDEHSRTMYQVDRTLDLIEEKLTSQQAQNLDYIEKKLKEFEGIFNQHNFKLEEE